ncbi:MAG: TAXI family TRAP transporter solute-binding subunit [Alphaproteobacteria bacterium]|nr:TAXI family TRAP transporter solute-binding subunit [Alphaproteobacteria bacterium]
MDKIRIASSDLLSTFYEQAKALGQVLVEEGIAKDAEILPTTGSVMNAEMVARGEADLGFMASNWVPRAVQGASPFSAPVAVAIAAPLNAGPLFFVVKADSPLTSVSQLRGRKVAVGHRDSGMAQHALNMVRVFGWGEDGMDFAFISTFDGGNALADGEVDAQFQAPIPSTHFTALCERTPIKVLAYDNGEIEAACHQIPFYSPAVVPGAFVPGQQGDVAAIGVLNVIVAAADGDAEFIAGAVAAYIRRAGDIEKMNPLFRGLAGLLARARTQGEDALAPGVAPLHPAAAAAFREAGLLT